MAELEYPWPPASATGLGPFPGTDPVEAARTVFGELSQLPFLPTLPERGVGADPVGRTAALLVDLHVDLQPGGWRLVPRPGRDERRARETLIADLDALEEGAGPYRGALKVQLLGPLTLAARLDLARGEKALADRGAMRDLAASLSEGLARHAEEVRRRLPGLERVVVQLDEPLLDAVVGGALPTASGWGRLPAIDEPVAADILREVVAAAGAAVGVRSTTTRAPVSIIRRAGACFFGADAETITAAPEEDLGEALEGGMGLLLALVPLDEAEPLREPAALARPVRALWQRLGLSLDLLPGAVAIAPVEGLEDVTPDVTGGILRRGVEVARFLQEVASQGAW